MIKDPRSSRRYTQLRKAWLASQPHPICVLCGRPVPADAPGMSRWGPTIEHLLPIREIRAMATTWDEAVALACDTSRWAVAHRVCNDRQGGRTNGTPKRPRTTQSRVW